MRAVETGGVEFRVLGPLEVVDRGRRLAVGTAKQQALLAVLVLHANEVVSRERLVDELWGERPPVTAAKAVQVYVSQLRKALAANGSAIATRGDGYVLEVPPECVDATRFERLVAEGQALMRAGEHKEAVRSLREALGLWRGRPLAGLTFEWHTRAEVERLEELRLGALMDRLDCELLLGRHDQTIAELELLVAQNPLQERLRGQLMLALYRSGRQADALAVYREGRETLVEELAHEQSDDLQRLERAILTQDPALERPSTFGPVRVEHGCSRRVRTSRRLLVIAAGLAAVALGAGAAIALVAGRDEAREPAPAPARLAPDSLGVVDPRSPWAARRWRSPFVSATYGSETRPTRPS